MISDWTQRIGLVVHPACFIHADCTRKLHWSETSLLLPGSDEEHIRFWEGAAWELAHLFHLFNNAACVVAAKTLHIWIFQAHLFLHELIRHLQQIQMFAERKHSETRGTLKSTAAVGSAKTQMTCRIEMVWYWSVEGQRKLCIWLHSGSQTKPSPKKVTPGRLPTSTGLFIAVYILC